MVELSDLLENSTSLLSDCLKDGLPGLESALTKLSLEAPEEYQAVIYQASSYATAEFLQLIGIGSGFTSLNMQGYALAQISKKLDEIKKKLDIILGAPAIAACDFFKRGIQEVQAENYSVAYEEFKKVVEKTIEARIYQKDDLEIMVNLTQYVIFADLMIGTYIRSSDLFVPYELLEPKKKKGIRSKITDHLEKLLETKEMQKTPWFSLPSSKSAKKAANQNIVDSILKNSLQFICPPGEPVPLRFVPDGVEDAALLNLDGKPGKVDASTVFIHKEGTNVVIRHYSNMATIDCEHRQELLVTANQSGLTIDKSTREVEPSNYASLIDASANGDSAVVSLLVLQPGVQVNQWDSDDMTPLHLAALGGHLEVVSLLLLHPGVQINQTDSSDMTPLHLAAWQGHLEVTRILLRAGADKSPVDNGKHTPLHLAAYWGHLEVVKVLVEAGGDTMAVDSDDRTPAQAAKSRGHKDVVKYLENV